MRIVRILRITPVDCTANNAVGYRKESMKREKDKPYVDAVWPASWSSGQSLWLIIMRSRVRFPALSWEFSSKGKIPTVTMVWVD